MIGARFHVLFSRQVVRDVLRHKVLATLNVLSVGLGVALYLAIQIANHSANRALIAGVDVVAGKANLEVRGEIPDSVLPDLAKAPGVKGATPLVEGLVTIPKFPGEYLRIEGIDIFTNEPFRTFELGTETSRFNLESWLSSEEGIAVSGAFARKHGLAAGDNLVALVNSRSRTLKILFLLETREDAAGVLDHVAAMDIGWAQELFGRQGKLSSIQILLRKPEDVERVAANLRGRLPPGATIAAPGQRSFQVQKMLSAFELNLTALSLVSMLVGMFLIYNTVSASVIRRRVEIGILRSIGASRSEVRLLFLGEAFLFGILGALAGIVGGILLANSLVGSVARTISSLYVLMSIDRFFITPTALLSSAALGMAAVLAAAWLPADEAARTNPVRALSLGTRMEEKSGTVRYWVAAGVSSLALAWAASWFALRTGPALLGFIAAFLVLFGFTCFSPILIEFCGSAGIRASGGSLLWRLASGNFQRSVHRNSATVAALSAAIALMAGVSVMIFSFRNTVNAWINHGFVADIFIAPASNETIGLGSFIPAEAVTFLEKEPAVADVDTFREMDVSMDGNAVALGVVKGAERRNLQFVGGDDRGKLARFLGSESVIITESFARKWGRREGDTVVLGTPGGMRRFPIAGIYYDYTRDQGLIMMKRTDFERNWSDTRVESIGIHLKDSSARERVSEIFRQRFGRLGEFAIFSNRALKQRVFEIFDQTFAVTYVLRVIVIIVAVLGIFLSLITLITERRREVGILRAVGASQAQIEWIVLFEAAYLGIASSVLGVAAGIALSMVLTWVVNKAFFGWTIALQFPWLLLAGTPLWIIPAALAAAWVPARRAVAFDIAEAVRSE